MNRIAGRRNLAEVRWVLNRRGGRPIAVPDAHWMRIRQTPGPLGRLRVRHVLICQGQRRPPTWLTSEQRHLIMPIALWDVADQIEAATALSRELTGRPPSSPEAAP
jgi:hypothetical protein